MPAPRINTDFRSRVRSGAMSGRVVCVPDGSRPMPTAARYTAVEPPKAPTRCRNVRLESDVFAMRLSPPQQARRADAHRAQCFAQRDLEIDVESRVPEAAVEAHRRAGGIDGAAVELGIGESIGHIVENVLCAYGESIAIGDPIAHFHVH